jgi:hypothetical protein
MVDDGFRDWVGRVCADCGHPSTQHALDDRTMADTFGHLLGCLQIHCRCWGWKEPAR